MDVTLGRQAHEYVGAFHRLRPTDALVGSGSPLGSMSSVSLVEYVQNASDAVAVPTIRTRQASTSRRADAPAPVAHQALAEWQGMVTEVGETHFVAELQGKIGQGVSGSIEEARIPVDEVSPEDRELLRPGAFFRLCITRELTPHGSSRRYTQVVFRRMPAYRREDLEAARAEARELVRELRVE